VLELIVQEQRAEVARWKEVGAVPVSGPLALDALNNDVALYLRESGLKRVVDKLSSEISSESHEDQQNADRIREAMVHLQAIAAEARSVRRRLMEGVSDEAVAGVAAIERMLEKAGRGARRAGR